MWDTPKATEVDRKREPFRIRRHAKQRNDYSECMTVALR